MQIIIPMSGFGERFRQKGYDVPKPLIEIDGKPIIAHVINMFPGETKFLFICNEDHLNTKKYQMQTTLQKLCPTGKIISIPSHHYGPVYAVLQAEKYIDALDSVVVNYCDFTCFWDWHYFKKWVSHLQCEGAVPAYRGFHPHTLGSTNYAYILEENGWMRDIQEKKSYTDNRMNEYASSGTYYFSTGKIMLDAFKQVIEQDMNINDEYYVSLAYKILLKNKLHIAVYDLQHFMQWGTPEDVAEYNNWSDTFRRLTNYQANHDYNGIVIIPMAGLGLRYACEGYKVTKPLIQVSGRPMVVQATYDLPPANQYVFVPRLNMPGFEALTETLQQIYPNVIIETVSEVTEGQACTALLGLKALIKKMDVDDVDRVGPITVGACDNGALYDRSQLNILMEDQKTDVIVWAVRGHANAIRHPAMYGWISVEGDIIKNISVKTPLASPETDPIVLGTFTFKRASDFMSCIDRMIQRDARINGEFYVDTCINDGIALGLTCKIFEVDSYISWGTPNDLRTFEYWQSCFHKWSGHPYNMTLDTRIPHAEIAGLEKRYQATVPLLLELPA
jgi:dTDP-glucose pyrophosphorylase